MRVISGTARGRHLRAAPETRPTADVIKGAIFSMLEALAYKRGFEPNEEGDLAAALAWPKVLDLFAGSGALGVEALSRGAKSAEFVEQDREAARVIASNLPWRCVACAGRLTWCSPIRRTRPGPSSPTWCALWAVRSTCCRQAWWSWSSPGQPGLRLLLGLCP